VLALSRSPCCTRVLGYRFNISHMESRKYRLEMETIFMEVINISYPFKLKRCGKLETTFISDFLSTDYRQTTNVSS